MAFSAGLYSVGRNNSLRTLNNSVMKISLFLEEQIDWRWITLKWWRGWENHCSDWWYLTDPVCKSDRPWTMLMLSRFQDSPSLWWPLRHKIPRWLSASLISGRMVEDLTISCAFPVSDAGHLCLPTGLDLTLPALLLPLVFIPHCHLVIFWLYRHTLVICVSKVHVCW